MNQNIRFPIIIVTHSDDVSGCGNKLSTVYYLFDSIASIHLLLSSE